MDIEVRVRSALLFRSEPRAAGSVLKVNPWDAYELVTSRRAELVDPTDAEHVRKAVEAHNAKALSRSGSGRSTWR
jgi:hypothetical protein